MLMKGSKEILVCYDVEDNKSRKKIFDGLKDYGLYSVQKSVFWGRVLPAEEKAILLLLKKWIDTSRGGKAFIVDAHLSSEVEKKSVGYSDVWLSIFQDTHYHVL